MVNILKVLIRIFRILKNILKKFQTYQDGLDYLFNEHNDENYITDPINEARKLFNETRSNHSRDEIKRIRKKLYKKEAAYNLLKEKELKGSLRNKEKNKLKNIGRYLKNFKKGLEKLRNHQLNVTHGIDYLFNELAEECNQQLN